LTKVFISYSHADGQIAQDLNARLTQANVTTFFDRQRLIAGRRWVPELEDALKTCSTVALLIGPGGIGNTQQYERQLALVRQTAHRDFPVIPVLLPGSEPPTGFLQLLTWVDLRKGLGADTSPAALLTLIAGIQGQPADSEEIRARICPYVGLQALKEEDAPFFCGREAVTQALVDEVGRHRLVAVVGRSGSGKSSLVFAGLLPRLRQDRRFVWDVVTMRPGDRPLHALAGAFGAPPEGAGPAVRENWLEQEAAAWRSGQPDMLLRMARQRLGSDGQRDRLLLVVDQWEELYTALPAGKPGEAGGDAARFVAMLHAAAARDAEVSIVLTVRADFYDRLLKDALLSPWLPAQQVNIGPLGPDDLRQMIEQPAKRAGLRFDPPSLVDDILHDAGTDPGVLPLLQSALQGTWRKREGSRLTPAGYQLSGGVQGAIQTRAEEVYAKLSETERRQARGLFLGLVRLGEGQEDTRARMPLPTDAALARLVGEFTRPNNRLLIGGDDGAGRPTVEVAHEALIRAWPTLRGWVNENRDRLRTRDWLRTRVRDWEEAGKLPGALLQPGYELSRAQKLLE